MKKFWEAALLFSIIVTTSCGKVTGEKVHNLADSKSITIRILVNISYNNDAEIFIKTNSLTVDKEKMTLTVKDALLSDYNNLHMFAIGVNEATFSFPLGGGEIEIWGPSGSYQKITDESFEEKKGRQPKNK